MCSKIKCCQHPAFKIVATLLAFSLGVIGCVFLIISVEWLESMPAEYLCELQGYEKSDCTSMDQARFAFANNLSCLLVPGNDASCLNPPPHCCIGQRDLNKSYSFGSVAHIVNINVNQLSCLDIAKSLKTGFQRCGKPSPCPDVINNGSTGNLTWPLTDTSSPPSSWQNLSDSDLEDYEDAIYEECVEDRLQGGFFIMHLSGPMIAVVVGLLALAHYRRSKALSSIGVFISSTSIAILFRALTCVLDLTYGLEWDNLTDCQSKDQNLVSHGDYLNYFRCVDVTIGGDYITSRSWEWLSKSLAYFFAGTVLSVVSLAIYLLLLMTKWGWSPFFTKKNRIPSTRTNHVQQEEGSRDGQGAIPISSDYIDSFNHDSDPQSPSRTMHWGMASDQHSYRPGLSPPNPYMPVQYPDNLGLFSDADDEEYDARH